MTTTEPEDVGRTAPIEVPTSTTSGSAAEEPLKPAEPLPRAHLDPTHQPETGVDQSLNARGVSTDAQALEGAPARYEHRLASAEAAIVARPATPMQQEVMFVPLAVTIGDGFKFGCGFFLASILTMLIGFVLLAALFVLTSLFGLNLPLGR